MEFYSAHSNGSTNTNTIWPQVVCVFAVDDLYAVLTNAIYVVTYIYRLDIDILGTGQILLKWMWFRSYEPINKNEMPRVLLPRASSNFYVDAFNRNIY